MISTQGKLDLVLYIMISRPYIKHYAIHEIVNQMLYHTL